MYPSKLLVIKFSTIIVRIKSSHRNKITKAPLRDDYLSRNKTP